MPQYAFLMDTELEIASMPARLAALRAVGVPYSDEMIENATIDAAGQANPDSDAVDGVFERYGDDTNARSFDGQPGPVTEMDALVAYLQILGNLTDVATKTEPVAEE